jgi:ribosomal protein S18 acetylase RimI-like enzyme
MRTAGLASAALDVNGRNESATRLYTSLGMRVHSRAERYEKRLG